MTDESSSNMPELPCTYEEFAQRMERLWDEKWLDRLQENVGFEPWKYFKKWKDKNNTLKTEERNFILILINHCHEMEEIDKKMSNH